MGQFVNPDSSAFKEAVNSEIYVDKSSLITYTNKALGTLQKYICNSRPRRFGKSITANMLTAYYSKGADSKELFSSLEIASSSDFEEHLNKYDVIRLDIQACLSYVEEKKDVIKFITSSVVGELKEIYPEEVNGNEKSLALLLSRMNVKKGHRFVFIIDEWDVLIRDNSDNVKLQDDYIEFLRTLFKSIDSPSYIALGYITGILPIKREQTQSALNNFKEYTMLNPSYFAPYFGFTEKEVKTLCNKYSLSYEEASKWYDGYILNGYHVYNPMSVVNAILDGKFMSYWSETSSIDLVVPLIKMNFLGLKEDIIAMISGDAEIPVNPKTFKNDTVSISSRDNVLTYLIHLGYLGYNEDNDTAFIPNEEIREEMGYAVESCDWEDINFFMKESDEILEATLEMNGELVARGVENMHEDLVSIVKYNDENSLSLVLTHAYFSSRKYYFSPIRELPSGKGFTDLVFIPKPKNIGRYPALVVELKWNKDAKSAIDQIKEKNYPKSIKKYTDNILLVGINYDKKTKKHECLIEKL